MRKFQQPRREIHSLEGQVLVVNIQVQANKLSLSQKSVIRRGFQAGLSENQIATYTNSRFTAKQMEQIRLAILNGLTPSEIRVIADPLVHADEMKRLRLVYASRKQDQ